MKGLVTTAASRAWLVVALAGLVLVVLVVGLQLVPRLTGGQAVIDAAGPAMTKQAVAGEVAATGVLARYVDLVDPLVARRGRGSGEVARLRRLIARRAHVSRRAATALLRHEAPHVAALLRALPLSAVASERPRLTRFLAGTLNVGDEDLQDEFARSFPRLFQTLSELPSMTSGWYDVPGVEAMTRFDARTPVRTMPDVRDYLRDDLMASVEHEQQRFRYLAAWGGIGYIPYLLLVAGIVAIAFGLFEVRRAASSPPGRPAWAGVVAIGFVILLAIAGLQYFPRLNGADTMISRLRPAFEQPRVEGLRAGTDLVVQSALFGDPIMTRAGGAAAEYPELVATVAERSGQSHSRVRRGLRGAAPRTAALLEALPLSSAAREVPHLLAVLARRMHTDDRRLVRTLRRRTPALTRSILALGPVTAGWNAMPGTADLERFDGVTPVRAVPAFGDYLDRDVVPILEGQHEHFDKLANTWPPVRVLPGLLLAFSVLAVLYGVAMMFRATKP